MDPPSLGGGAQTIRRGGPKWSSNGPDIDVPIQSKTHIDG